MMENKKLEKFGILCYFHQRETLMGFATVKRVLLQRLAWLEKTFTNFFITLYQVSNESKPHIFERFDK